MKKLLCVIIEGLRADALACVHAGCLERMVRDGVYSNITVNDRSGRTLPELYTLLTSLWPEEDGVTTNFAPDRSLSLDVFLTSLLHARQQKVSMFYSRVGLEQLVPSRHLHASVFNNSRRIQNVDLQLGYAAAGHLQGEKPDLCLLHIDGVDIAGHNFGFMSEPYFEAVETADHCIAHILEELRFVGLHEEYVTMVLSGHCGLGCSHNYNVPEVHQLPWIIFGSGIDGDAEIKGQPSLVDVAPTMAEILDVPLHPDWQGRVVREILCGSADKMNQQEKKHSFHLLEPDCICPAA